MTKRILPLIALLTFFLSPATAAQKPNILLILADDLGYSDLSCYGSEIQTPNLNALAASGLRFTQFHNTARCWPTRAALLTGFYAQQVGRDAIPGLKRGNRPEWASLLPVFLKNVGYRSYHSGKWHIDGFPIEAGFDRSYYVGDQDRFFTPTKLYLDDIKLPQPKTSDNYYATTAIANHAIETLQEHAAQTPTQPFFHYLAFTAPHFPLHALPEDIAHYKGAYDKGWDVIRTIRHAKQTKLGIANTNHPISKVQPNVGPPYYKEDGLDTLGPNEVFLPVPWASLSKSQRKFQATKMEIHAAMIHRVDLEVGRVIAQLKSMNAFDNTLILFLSDNGASAEIMVRADMHDPTATPGSAPSYLCLGPGWATASNTPFRYHKTWTHQGGTSTPLIAHWPDGISDRNVLRTTPGHVIDIVPTLIEITGANKNTTPHWPASGAPKAPGHSLLPAFANDVTIARDNIWWAHDNHRAIRVADWKLVALANQPWELYDLSSDPNETKNLAARYPNRVEKLNADWQAFAQEIINNAKIN